MALEGHDARTERVMVPHWVRGQEEGAIVAPVQRNLHLLTLGGSVGTPRRGIVGDVVVVSSFDELEALGDTVAGKIILFNRVMPAYNDKDGSQYGPTVTYRGRGPQVAGQKRAIAALVRSVTARSLRSPHTGAMWYEPKAPQVPGVASSVEDAELIARLAAAGETVRVRLKLGAKTLPDAPSANVIAELRGREKPDEIVLIGAHIDSWDVGQGAHDDGAGCAIVMEALSLVRRMGLTPRRTIRVVLFTNEENGTRGARAYAAQHKGDRHIAAIEADSGGFDPTGWDVDGTDAHLSYIGDIASLLASLRADDVDKGTGGGADIAYLKPTTIPLIGFRTEGSRYFDYHHSQADTLDKVDPESLRKGVAAMAVMAYVLADAD